MKLSRPLTERPERLAGSAANGRAGPADIGIDNQSVENYDLSNLDQGMSRNVSPSKRRTVGIVLFLLALILVSIFFFQRFFFLPKILIIVLIILAAVLLGRTRLLVKDWFVFIAFAYLFDSLRGTIYILTCRLQLPVHTLYVMDIEKRLFGGIPSVDLQNLLLHADPSGQFTRLERILTVFYGSHYIAFLFVGFLIWIYRTKGFPLFRTSFLFLISLGILAYFLVPTVPPWMASGHFGLLPPLTRFNTILFNFAVPDISDGFDTNPIAAMPSLHAAFPLLCALLIWRFFRWKGLAYYIYALTILFTIVYTGDHYITDILAGLALSVACYLIALRIHKKALTEEEGEPPQRSDVAFEPAALKNRLLLGLAVMFVGVVIGSANKTQFLLHGNLFGPDAPRYADFFKNEGRYRDNYLIQRYFGNHFLLYEDYPRALGYLERAAALGRNPAEVEEAGSRAQYCRNMLSLKD